jgi:hypothetical protein
VANQPGTKLAAVLFLPGGFEGRAVFRFGNVRFQVLGTGGAGVGIRGLSVGPDVIGQVLRSGARGEAVRCRVMVEIVPIEKSVLVS